MCYSNRIYTLCFNNFYFYVITEIAEINYNVLSIGIASIWGMHEPLCGEGAHLPQIVLTIFYRKLFFYGKMVKAMP